MQPLLKISNITKEYEKVVALNDVSLEIQKGSVFGLLGPNGAGKTSLIRILAGITIPDKGHFTLDSNEKRDFDTLSKMIGYLPEERGLYKEMTVIEQLEFFGRIKGLSKKEVTEKAQYWGERTGIIDWFDKKAQELSKGMQQMVQFTSTIFYDPTLIILDEPFTGLDPINSNKMKNLFVELQSMGKTIIFSTHRMEQVEEICDKIVLIHKGRIILEGAITDIKHKFKKHVFKVIYDNAINKQDLLSIPDIEVLDSTSNSLTIKDTSITQSKNELIKKLLTLGEIQSFKEILPALNEIFIEQVNNYSIEHNIIFEEDKIDE